MTCHPALGADPGCTRVALPTGILEIEMESASKRTIEALCTFAARRNSRRGFLFVSKVLGKHYPARPQVMREIHEGLAAAVPARPEDRILVIGMAETATGLGFGVFEALRRAHPGISAMYLHTTRYWSEGVTVAFEEEHSHAPSLCFHVPEDAQLRKHFGSASLLVLVDDEASTGNTFCNLVAAYRAYNPFLQAVHVATITDFSGPEGKASMSDRMGVPVSFGASACGRHRFVPCGTMQAQPEASAQPSRFRKENLPGRYGRLGTSQEIRIPGPELAKVTSALKRGSGPVMVLGTGEFMHAAFALAIRVEEDGFETLVQATTRSPILIGGGIRCAMEVPDPYGETGVPFFLYNFQRGDYSDVLVCHETDPSPALDRLLRQLGARGVRFSQRSNDGNEELSVR